MAGGKGSRLDPLTKHRAKPSVPFGAKYRIIDFVLSNMVNSGIYSIFILTQFLSQSLNEHIRKGWDFGSIRDENFVVTVPAQMRTGDAWYQGTADAVYQNLHLVRDLNPRFVAVFAGDHIFRMDITQMIDYHHEKGADVTVAVVPVPTYHGCRYGVVEVDKDWRVTGFEEKPADPKTLADEPEMALASMGNYIFSRDVLINALEEDAFMGGEHDFGHDILPRLCRDNKVFAYDFRGNDLPGMAPGEKNGYWRDVGTIEAYWEANMDLKSVFPELNLYDRQWPIRTVTAADPPAKFVRGASGKMGEATDSLLSGGCLISGGLVTESLLSPNVLVKDGAEISNSVILDDVVIEEGAKITRAIVDKECRIGRGAHIGFDLEKDKEKYFVSDSGIVVLEKRTRVESD